MVSSGSGSIEAAQGAETPQETKDRRGIKSACQRDVGRNFLHLHHLKVDLDLKVVMGLP